MLANVNNCVLQFTHCPREPDQPKTNAGAEQFRCTEGYPPASYPADDRKKKSNASPGNANRELVQKLRKFRARFLQQQDSCFPTSLVHHQG
ncbi:hypothetical protein OIU79_019893 [Salix purpurea]|uniref:Uncharacterized protein n=1 Tax=Salix purpurea TaxID=77065 RepID=A0A9Q0P2C3_SALPP|nr:hypothetical protein OIU79_019893 [Salix purpurea]